MADTRIIQLMPAPDWYVEYSDSQGPIIDRVLCLALQADGDVVFLDCDCHGCVDVVTHAGNFVRVFQKEEGDEVT